MMNYLKNLVADMYLPRPPRWMVAIALILAVGSWIPLAFVARSKVQLSEARPIHFFQDMFNQPKVTTQKTNAIFADNRAMRAPVTGTVSRNAVLDDDHFLLGYYTDDNGLPETYEEDGEQLTRYYEGFPEKINVTESFVIRGQVNYNVYCYPCHGMAGQGDGPISIRAEELQNLNSTSNNWVPASNIVQIDQGGLTYGTEQYADGKMFNVISNGIRNMAGYKSQITPEDRWAIVAYVRALQLSQYAPLEDVPADQRGRLN